MSTNAISLIIKSQQLGMVWLRYLMAAAFALLGLAGLRFSIEALIPPNVYQKDFMQEYLMARAVLDGGDPYLPLPELAASYLGNLPRITLPHPTPHPPPVALLSIPFGLIPYELSASIWFLLELVFIFISVYLLLGILGRKQNLLHSLFLTLLMLSWRPVIANLSYGQLMTLLLVLLLASWKALRTKRDILGGGFIGLVIAVKLMAWPVVLYMVLKGRWKAVFSAGAVLLGTNLVAGLLLRFDRLLYYYLEVSRAVSPIYRAHEGNFSLWTIGWRFFEGTGSPGLSGVVAPPLAVWPQAAVLVSIALPFVILAFGLIIAHRMKSFDSAFCVLICISLLVNPIFWVVYLILCLLPIALIVKKLSLLAYPKWETYLTAGLMVFVFLPREILVALLRLVSVNTAQASMTTSFAGSLVTLLPVFVIFALIMLLWDLDKEISPGL